MGAAQLSSCLVGGVGAGPLLGSGDGILLIVLGHTYRKEVVSGNNKEVMPGYLECRRDKSLERLVCRV